MRLTGIGEHWTSLNRVKVGRRSQTPKDAKRLFEKVLNLCVLRIRGASGHRTHALNTHKVITDCVARVGSALSDRHWCPQCKDAVLSGVMLWVGGITNVK
jgi:hypothetical protein